MWCTWTGPSALHIVQMVDHGHLGNQMTLKSKISIQLIIVINGYYLHVVFPRTFLDTKIWCVVVVIVTLVVNIINQTPAERVRAKMKLLLEKASDDKTTPIQKTTPLHNAPSQCDILAIESESFAPKAFQASRNKKDVS